MFYKVKKVLLILLLYGLIALIINFIHSRFFNVNVVFYSSLFDCLIAALFILPIFCSASMTKVFSLFEKTLVMIICILCGYIYAISIPTVIDRSLSIYILEKILDSGGAVSNKDFIDIVSRDYINEHKIAEIRLTEQMHSGTLINIDDCIVLTKRGYAIAAATDYYRKNFLPKQRLLGQKYTDDLTHPINNTEKYSYKDCDNTSARDASKK